LWVRWKPSSHKNLVQAAKVRRAKPCIVVQGYASCCNRFTERPFHIFDGIFKRIHVVILAGHW